MNVEPDSRAMTRLELAASDAASMALAVGIP